MPDFRSRRHIADSAVLQEYGATPIKDENENTIGISIGKWSISSSSSRIGNEGEMDRMEAAVQAKAGSVTRVALPEIVFTSAHVSLEVLSSAEMRFTAQDALEEWAECHRHLNNCSYGDTPYKGVSVIKSIDAKIWEEKFSDNMKHITNSFEIEKCSTEFHYDWTFSSPFSGNFYTIASNAPMDWIESEESGIDMQMLLDQSQPILYFDDVNLYEDDMHDNGYVSLRCKLRVMPTCVYILLTLFVRVDHVLIRVKETRIFSSFQHKYEDKLRVFKDIVWRECPWKCLEKERLPMDITSWRIEEEDIGGATVQKRMLSLIRNLPVYSLPQHLMAHSYVDVPE
jgi:type 2A phosphatase activator TIP41